MKIAGKVIQFGDRLTITQKNYLQQRVMTLARYLHGQGYSVDMTTSVSTDSIYLEVNGKNISFRNHPGKGSYYSVIISSFPNWREVKKYVLNHIVPKVPSPEKLSHNFLELDLKENIMKDNETLNPLNEEVLEYLDNIERNIDSIENSMNKISKDENHVGQVKYVVNLMRNTTRNINKIKEKVK